MFNSASKPAKPAKKQAWRPPATQEPIPIYPPGHYFRINVKSTIYLFVLNIVRMFLNFVSMMVDWILNTHFAVEKVDVANGREHPHY